MVERPRNDVTDGKSWKCPQCKTRNSIREGSFFSKSRMSLQKWLLIIYLWARDYPVTDAAQEVEITKTSAIDVRSMHNEAPPKPNHSWGSWDNCAN